MTKKIGWDRIPGSKYRIKRGSIAHKFPLTIFALFIGFEYLLFPLWLIMSLVRARREILDNITYYLWNYCIPPDMVAEIWRGIRLWKKEANQ